MSENKEMRLSSISKADSYEAIGEFWDTHSSADYWEQGYDVEFEVQISRRRRINIEAELYTRITEEASRRGVQPETLVNLWIAERLHQLDAPKRERTESEAAEKQLAEKGESYTAE